MKLLSLLRDLSARPELPFLLIGGHAVNLHGYSRNTHDLDLLIKRSQLKAWQRFFQDQGYVSEHEDQNFIQLRAPDQVAAWPVDLMLVNDETFTRLSSSSLEFNFSGARVRTPSIPHLIALKLHVLRQNLTHRTIKDFLDVQGLVEVNRVDLNNAEIKEIFERYGTPDLYRRLKLACGQQEQNDCE